MCYRFLQTPWCPWLYDVTVVCVTKCTVLYHGWLSHYNDVIMGTLASQITSIINVYSTVYSGADQRKHQSSALLAFVWGIRRRPVNSPHKWPVTRKMFPFDDVIMVGMGSSLFTQCSILIDSYRAELPERINIYMGRWVFRWCYLVNTIETNIFINAFSATFHDRITHLSTQNVLKVMVKEYWDVYWMLFFYSGDCFYLYCIKKAK